jgi:hypothetical protein
MARGDSDALSGTHEHSHEHETEFHIEPLVKLVNEKLAAHGGGPFIQGPFSEADTEKDADEAVVTGRLGGRGVVLRFHIDSGKPGHAYHVSLTDDASGDELGGGKPQSTFSDSISAYRWETALKQLAGLG